ncbi:MAG: GNAT family N-acetyltransferase [Cyanobacteria bacterium J06627_8]
MSQQTYLKLPFVWEEPQPLVEVSSRLTYEPAKAMSDDRLISIVAQVMAESVDASDQRRASGPNLYTAVELFLTQAKEGFSYQDEWWQFGLNEQREIVGFVLPVIFSGYAKDGLEEGTIYYIGVIPKYRGLGLATDLLLKGTQTLQEVGVWRVLCDTSVDNVRMISAFKRVGYRPYGEPWERPV